MSDTVLKVKKRRTQSMRGQGNKWDKREAKAPDDLRPLGLVNKVKSDLIKVKLSQVESGRHPIPSPLVSLLITLRPEPTLKK